MGCPTFRGKSAPKSVIPVDIYVTMWRKHYPATAQQFTAVNKIQIGQIFIKIDFPKMQKYKQEKNPQNCSMKTHQPVCLLNTPTFSHKLCVSNT